MMKVTCLVVLLSLLGLCAATQIIEKGTCPDMATVQTFDGSQYVGKWYEYQKFPFLFELFGKCVVAEYTLNADGTIGVTNKQVRFNSDNSIHGTATFDGPTNVAKLSVVFEGVPSFAKGKYWVVGTDYVGYSVVWSCNQITPFLRALNAWVLTRDRVPSADVIGAAYAVITANKIPQKYFTTTDQSGCSN